jgi:hypothetical protein
MQVFLMGSTHAVLAESAKKCRENLQWILPVHPNHSATDSHGAEVLEFIPATLLSACVTRSHTPLVGLGETTRAWSRGPADRPSP